MIVSVVLAVVLAAIAIIDLRTLRIPDGLSLPLIALGLLVTFAQAPEGAVWDHLVGAVIGFLLLAGIGELHFRRRGTEGLGLGDAKLFAASGAWLGWQALPQVLLIAAIGGLAQALLRRGRHRADPLAFGPWLALGFGVVWAWSRLGGAAG